MDSLGLLIASIAVLSAGLVQVLTGFGYALVSIPLLMLVFHGYDAVLIGMILSVFTLALQARKDWKYTDWDIVWKLTVTGLIGIILGVTVGSNLNPIYLKGLVGATVLIYVLVEWTQRKSPRKRAAQVNPITANNRLNSSNKNTDGIAEKYPKGFYVAGMAAGLLTGIVGMPGPPVVAVLVNHLKKDVFRATLVSYFLINMLIALVLALFVFGEKKQLNIYLAVLYLIVPTIIGYLIGYPLRKVVNDNNFKKLIFMMLIAIGVSSIWQVIAIF